MLKAYLNVQLTSYNYVFIAPECPNHQSAVKATSIGIWIVETGLKHDSSAKRTPSVFWDLGNL